MTTDTAAVRAAFDAAVVNALVGGVTMAELKDSLDTLRTRLVGEGTEPNPRPVRTRRAVNANLLEEVAGRYREKVAAGLPPTAHLAATFGVSHGTAARWVREARKAGMLGPSLGPVAGERDA